MLGIYTNQYAGQGAYKFAGTDSNSPPVFSSTTVNPINISYASSDIYLQDLSFFGNTCTIDFGGRIYLHGKISITTTLEWWGLFVSGSPVWMTAGCNLVINKNNPGPVLGATNGGHLQSLPNTSVSINGNATYGVFTQCGGQCQFEGNVSGNFVGQRYYAVTHGRIITGGKGVNFLPGTIAGFADPASYGYYW